MISAHGAKGATVVSICDGALVVADSGLMKGREATAHWATQSLRAKRYPDTRWVDNVRYVGDGTIVSSAGISAAMPVSIALVEAIAGRDRAAALADELGVAEWGTAHNVEAMRMEARAVRWKRPICRSKPSRHAPATATNRVCGARSSVDSESAPSSIASGFRSAATAHRPDR